MRRRMRTLHRVLDGSRLRRRYRRARGVGTVIVELLVWNTSTSTCICIYIHDWSFTQNVIQVPFSAVFPRCVPFFTTLG